MFGPGVTAMSRAAAAKMTNCCVEIMEVERRLPMCGLTFEVRRALQRSV